jgi:hypothetical protein
MLNLGNEGTKLHKQSIGGCMRLELNNIFSNDFIATSSFWVTLFIYSNGEHMSYSASVGEVNAKA